MGKPKAGYSVGQAAKRLGISRQSVYDAIRDGRLQARVRVITRRVWRIDAQHLRAYRVSLSHQERGKQASLAHRPPKK